MFGKRKGVDHQQPILVTAIFDSRCPVCGQSIRVGDRIIKARLTEANGSERDRFICSRCISSAVNRAKFGL